MEGGRLPLSSQSQKSLGYISLAMTVSMCPIPEEIAVVFAFPHAGVGTKDLIIWPDGDQELGVVPHREHLAERRKHKSGLEPGERKMTVGGANNHLLLQV